MTRAEDAQHGWLLGRVHGVPVYLGRSWPIIAVVVLLTFGPQLQPELPAGLAYAVAAAYALLLLVSVLVHEAGHAVAARRTGARVDRIVATLWGGHTVFGGEHERPGSEALVAVAGPAGNLLLAGVGWVLAQALPPGVPALLATALWLTNVFVAAFNLLPGLPLDGGFVAHAIVWKITGDRSLALVVGGWLGRAVTVLAVVWFVGEPLLSGRTPSLVTMVWVGLVGAFLWQGATASIRSGQVRRVVAALRVGQVASPVVAVPLAGSAATLVEALGATPQAQRAVAVDPAGAPVAWVDLQALGSVPGPQLASVPVSALIVRPRPGWVVAAEPGDDAGAVVAALAAREEDGGLKDAVLLVDRSGRVTGVVALDDVEAALGG